MIKFLFFIALASLSNVSAAPTDIHQRVKRQLGGGMGMGRMNQMNGMNQMGGMNQMEGRRQIEGRRRIVRDEDNLGMAL